jgi:uncharacterized protein (DUF1501 family)
MRRRTFIAHSAALSAGLVFAGRLNAATSSSPKLLTVFLRGGYDCANMLVPYASSFYYESRPNIAVPVPSAGADSALRLDDSWALAPVLRDTLGSWYASKQIAFIPFAGTDDMSRSHFETQDNIERGLPVNAQHRLDSGFLARLASTLQEGRAIAFTDSLPLVFQGASDIPNISVRTIGKPVFDQRQASILTSMYEGTSLKSAIGEGLELREEVAKTMEQEMAQANRGAVSSQGFELEAKRIARLMREQYNIGFLDVGGWDTHVNEGGAAGALANNLQNLGRGLQAFAQELGSEWNNTVVVVLSEFGRTFRENGSRGTDHGHGTVYWIAGGAINGGRVLGEQLRVERSALLDDRDYPVLNNYRAVLGGLLQRMWSLSPSRLDTVFPDSASKDLGIL